MHALRARLARHQFFHRFERRFGHNPIKDDAQLHATLAYVANNPVAAGLCARPEDWLRSSYAATIGARDDSCLDVERLRVLVM